MVVLHSVQVSSAGINNESSIVFAMRINIIFGSSRPKQTDSRWFAVFVSVCLRVHFSVCFSQFLDVQHTA